MVQSIQDKSLHLFQIIVLTFIVQQPQSNIADHRWFPGKLFRIQRNGLWYSSRDAIKVCFHVEIALMGTFHLWVPPIILVDPWWDSWSPVDQKLLLWASCKLSTNHSQMLSWPHVCSQWLKWYRSTLVGENCWWEKFDISPLCWPFWMMATGWAVIQQ